jgi:uncharacterized tellurite resistance protein B-like protein
MTGCAKNGLGRFVALLTVLGLSIVCLLPADAFGRAGGGEGYGGGGGGGFGGGGGGNGGGDLIIWLIYLCFRHPLIGIPLLCIAAYLLYVSSKRGTSAYQSSVIRRGHGAMRDSRRAEAVERFQAGDPAFSEQAFYKRVAGAFLKIQQAWSQQNLNTVRPFVSDGIYERFSLQIQEQQDLRYRNVMENVVVKNIVLAQAISDEFFDLLSVRVEASATDYRISLDSGKRIAGSTQQETFVEYWTLLRRRGVKTSDRPGLIEGHCPNCGADIELNQSAICSSCDSLLRSGQYDWVLCEITQQSEWRDTTPSAIAGVDAYRARHDPGFNIQHLEDRAAVIFWRKAMADRLGDIRPLAKMATGPFCDEYAKQLVADSNGRRYWGDCAVGSVETLGVLPDGAMDRALVEIRWSGKMFATRPGKSPQRTSHGTLQRSLFVLGRRPGVQTDIGKSVTSAHCPSCGAPEVQLTSHACEFCGEVLNDGARDWVLREIWPLSSAQAQRLLGQLRDAKQSEVVILSKADGTPHGSQLLAWAIKMALADQRIDDKERIMLQHVAEKRGVPANQVDTLIAAVRDGELDSPEPTDREQGRDWLQAMVNVSLWDGHLHRDEYDLLCRVGARFDYSPHDVQMLLKKRKTDLYRRARQQLKQAK